LIAIVECQIAGAAVAVLAFAQLHANRSHTELVLDTADGPLLGKAVSPVAVGQPHESVDVLHNAGFLVVCLFDQKAVVRNGLGLLRFLGTNNRGAEDHGQD